LQDLQKDKEKAEKLKDKKQKEFDDAEKKIKKFSDELKNIENQIKSFDTLDKQITEKQYEVEAFGDDITKILTKIATTETQQKNEKEKIKECKQKIAETKKWKYEHQRYRNYYDWIREFFIRTVEEIEKQVLDSIRQRFNETYQRWYSILIEDPTKETRIDEDFTPIIEQDGYEQDVNFLSGGEKTSIALAYRLTLNSLMRKETEGMKSNLLILDEPTDGFSKTQLAKVRDVLRELNSEQIILVSHEHELENYVDNIFQVTKDTGLSHVNRISK